MPNISQYDEKMFTPNVWYVNITSLVPSFVRQKNNYVLILLYEDRLWIHWSFKFDFVLLNIDVTKHFSWHRHRVHIMQGKYTVPRYYINISGHLIWKWIAWTGGWRQPWHQDTFTDRSQLKKKVSSPVSDAFPPCLQTHGNISRSKRQGILVTFVELTGGRHFSFDPVIRLSHLWRFFIKG